VETKNHNHPRSKGLKNLTWDKLMGILRAHEVHLQNKEHLKKKNFPEQALRKKKRKAHLKL